MRFDFAKAFGERGEDDAALFTTFDDFVRGEDDHDVAGPDDEVERFEGCDLRVGYVDVRGIAWGHAICDMIEEAGAVDTVKGLLIVFKRG